MRQTETPGTMRGVQATATQTHSVRPITIEEWLDQAHGGESPTMLERHDAECGTRVAPVRVNATRYREMAASGVLLVLGAFVGDELVGYALSIIHRPLRYQDLVVVQNDLIYVAPEHRRRGIGRSLLLRTETVAESSGARIVVMSAKPGSALAALLVGRGYGLEELVFTRRFAADAIPEGEDTVFRWGV